MLPKHLRSGALIAATSGIGNGLNVRGLESVHEIDQLLSASPFVLLELSRHRIHRSLFGFLNRCTQMEV